MISTSNTPGTNRAAGETISISGPLNVTGPGVAVPFGYPTSRWARPTKNKPDDFHEYLAVREAPRGISSGVLPVACTTDTFLPFHVLTRTWPRMVVVAPLLSTLKAPLM